MNNRYRHAAETEKNKIVFQFALMLIASVIGGICFSNLLSDSALEKAMMKIISHFEASAKSSTGFSGLMLEYINFCLSDIICAVALFIFSFSFVNYIVSDAVLVFLGFRYGMNAAIIKLASFSVIGVGNSLSYWLLRAVILSVFMLFSCRMAFYSLTLRKFSPNGRLVVDRRALISEIIYLLTVIGLLLMINGLYCIFVFVF